MSQLTQPIKIHGGKHYLASKIVAMMPPHQTYVEPFAGGLSVMLAKDPEGVSEVANDLNKDLSNFWRTLQGGDSFKLFQRLAESTPFSELEWKDVRLEFDEWEEPDPAVSDHAVRAWRFFILCRMSLAGRRTGFASLTKNRTRRGMNEQVSAWLTAVDGLAEVHARLRRVLVLNRPAVDVIKEFDTPQTVIYADPPYLHETRATTKEYGQHEMTFDQHRELLTTLTNVEGKFMLSGYHSKLYDDTAHAQMWNCHEFELPNQAAGGKEKGRMVECVWTNF